MQNKPLKILFKKGELKAWCTILPGLFKSLTLSCLTTQNVVRWAFRSTSGSKLFRKFYLQSRDCQLNQALLCPLLFVWLMLSWCVSSFSSEKLLQKDKQRLYIFPRQITFINKGTEHAVAKLQLKYGEIVGIRFPMCLICAHLFVWVYGAWIMKETLYTNIWKVIKVYLSPPKTAKLKSAADLVWAAIVTEEVTLIDKALLSMFWAMSLVRLLELQLWSR